MKAVKIKQLKLRYLYSYRIEIKHIKANDFYILSPLLRRKIFSRFDLLPAQHGSNFSTSIHLENNFHGIRV